MTDKNYYTLPEAKVAVQRLKIRTQTEYHKRYKEEPRLHSNPQRFYKNEWSDWFDYLRKERPVGLYSTLAEAKVAVQRLKIKTQQEYKKCYKQEPRLPCEPFYKYREEWIDWYDFTGRERPVDLYPTLTQAKAAIKTLSIVSITEYKQRRQEDPHLPINPKKFYKNEWVDWYDYLGKERPAELYPTLSMAKAATQHLKIKTQREYTKRHKEDSSLPNAPDHKYREHWIDWYDFTGSERPVGFYPTLSEAKAAIKTLDIKSFTEYKQRHKEDPFLPAHPKKFYKNEWRDWYDYLGKENPARPYPTLAEAKVATQHLKIKSHKEYRRRYKEDPRLPLNADRTYQEHWIDWYDFFDKARPVKFYSTFIGAKVAVQRLGIKKKRNTTNATKRTRSYLLHPIFITRTAG